MRPIRVATLLLLAVVATGCGSEPAEEAAPADPPTTPAPSGPVGLPEGPPAPVLRSGDAEQQAVRGTYCWEQPAEGGLSMATCADAVAPRAEDLPVLPVRSGAPVELRFAMEEPPRELSVHLAGQPAGEGGREVVVAVSNPTSFVADVPPGTHFVDVQAQWPQGDGSFYAALDVR